MTDLTTLQNQSEIPAHTRQRPPIPLRQWVEWILIYGMLIIFAIVVGIPFIYMIRC